MVATSPIVRSCSHSTSSQLQPTLPLVFVMVNFPRSPHLCPPPLLAIVMFVVPILFLIALFDVFLQLIVTHFGHVVHRCVHTPLAISSHHLLSSSYWCSWCCCFFLGFFVLFSFMITIFPLFLIVVFPMINVTCIKYLLFIVYLQPLIQLGLLY